LKCNFQKKEITVTYPKYPPRAWGGLEMQLPKKQFTFFPPTATRTTFQSPNTG
jgi:hypothetical protein